MLLLVIYSGCSPKHGEETGERLLVVTSIFPVADIISTVGGDHVKVEFLVQPGQSPHTFEPLPGDMAEVSRADLIALVGFGFEYWSGKLMDNMQKQDARKLVFGEYVQPISDEDGGHHDEGHVDARAHYNPHFWLSPATAYSMAVHVRDVLVSMKPEAENEFDMNLDIFKAELEELDGEIKESVAGFSTREFVSFHSAWEYFARDYGLKQVAVIEESPGREPTPEKLARLIDRVRELKVGAIFAEPQLNPKAAEVIAREAGVRVAFLDPLGGPGVEGRESYIDLMRYNLDQLKAVMK